MTALCIACPLHWFCEMTGAMTTGEDRRLMRRNAELAEENARLRELAIENGLTCGAGETYVQQRP